MKEQLITFETAVLAKEKGFDIRQDITYILKDSNEWYESKGITQSLLQKWLREEHQINVESNYLPNIQKYRCLYVPMTMAIPNKEKYSLRSKYYGIDNHETYEHALEEGLQEALKLI